MFGGVVSVQQKAPACDGGFAYLVALRRGNSTAISMIQSVSMAAAARAVMARVNILSFPFEDGISIPLGFEGCAGFTNCGY